jgi:hypothetical protein
MAAEEEAAVASSEVGCRVTVALVPKALWW